MSSSIQRCGGAAIVAVLLAAGSVVAAASPTPASPSAACTGDEGVTVVVDFGTLGGGVQIRCVTVAVTSGFDALNKAGFTYTGTQRFPGLLCRINGKPADDPCVNAPPADRYWSYWVASEPGGTWNYSDVGAGNRVPPPGSVDGWAFDDDGCGRKPGSGPCPPPGTTTTRPPATTTTRPPTGGAGPTPTSRGATTSLGPRASTNDGSSTTTAGDDEDASTSTSTEDSGSGDRAPQAGQEGDDELAVSGAGVGSRGPGGGDDGGGSPVGLIVGIGAVLALGGAGALTARRRRVADAPDG